MSAEYRSMCSEIITLIEKLTVEICSRVEIIIRRQRCERGAGPDRPLVIFTSMDPLKPTVRIKGNDI